MKPVEYLVDESRAVFTDPEQIADATSRWYRALVTLLDLQGRLEDQSIVEIKVELSTSST